MQSNTACHPLKRLISIILSWCSTNHFSHMTALTFSDHHGPWEIPTQEINDSRIREVIKTMHAACRESLPQG